MLQSDGAGKHRAHLATAALAKVEGTGHRAKGEWRRGKGKKARGRLRDLGTKRLRD